MPKLKTCTAALAFMGVLATGACASAGSVGGDSAGSATEVVIRRFEFRPETVEIAAGTTVTWKNQDAILHTVTSGRAQKQGVPGVTKDRSAEPSGLFDSELDGVGATFSFTFTETGEVSYFCSIHPGMVGKVIVR